MRKQERRRRGRPKAGRLLLAALAALVLMPAGGGAAGGNAMPGDACLHLSGTVRLDEAEAVIGEPFTLAYTLMPGGTLAQTVRRPPADVVLVLDVSGSMNEKMKKHGNETRLEALQEASQVLLRRFRELAAGDRVGVITFQTSGEERLGLTADYDRAERTIRGLRAGGNTNMGSALEAAERMLAGSPAERKAVIALTDGMNTHYTRTISFFGQQIRQDVLDYGKAREYAKEWADRLAARGIPIYTIALGQPGMHHIDHQLLEEIARDSGGRKYDAEDAERLSDAFADIGGIVTPEGELADIRIVQPLPGDGFELAGAHPPGTHVAGGRLIIPLPPVPYPYGEAPAFTVEVSLRQTDAPGEYVFADAALAYRNACGNPAEAVIPNGRRLSVVGWTDTWGNLYVGRSNGEVTRYRLGDLAAPQFTIQEREAKVTDISFLDSAPGVDDDAIVLVAYEDGSASRWDLRPTAPLLAVFAADGRPLADGAWGKGEARLEMRGAGSQLPEGTVHHNGDFLTAGEGGTYIARYRYRAGGPWRETDEGVPAGLAAGGRLQVEAAALTAAVSGDPSRPVAGLTATADVLLDDAPPRAELAVLPAASGDPLDPVIRVTAFDAASGIADIAVTAETPSGESRTLGRAFSPAPDAAAEWPLSAFFADPEARSGWLKFAVHVADAAGWTSDRFRTGDDPAEKSVHYELVYAGPAGRFATDGDYAGKASAVPVTVRLEDVAERLVAGRTEECETCGDVVVTGVEVKRVTVKPDGSTDEIPWTKLGALAFRLTGEGRHALYLRVTDSNGRVYDTEALGEPFIVWIRYDQNRH